METSANGCRQLVTLRMGRKKLAIDLERVHGFSDMKTFTPFTGRSGFVRGRFSRGGVNLPVVDLGIKYGMPPKQITWRTCLIVAEIGCRQQRTLVGALADAGGELLQVERGAVKPAPRIGAGVPASFVEGVVKLADEEVVVLNLSDVVSVSEQELLGESLASVEPETLERKR